MQLIKCKYCEGTGKTSKHLSNCTICDGSGWSKYIILDKFIFGETKCNNVISEHCWKCGGSGHNLSKSANN